MHDETILAHFLAYCQIVFPIFENQMLKILPNKLLCQLDEL